MSRTAYRNESNAGSNQPLPITEMGLGEPKDEDELRLSFSASDEVFLNTCDLRALDDYQNQYVHTTAVEVCLSTQNVTGCISGSPSLQSYEALYYSGTFRDDEANGVESGGNHTAYGYDAILGQLGVVDSREVALGQSHFSMAQEQSALTPLVHFDDSSRCNGAYDPVENSPNNGVTSTIGTGPPSERVSCIHAGCAKTFTRATDLDRHIINVHNRVGHHCRVLGCSNNKGYGYCRTDKLKEHMWKKHGFNADHSYTNAARSSFDSSEWSR